MLSKFLESSVKFVEFAEAFSLEQERFAGEIWFGADREWNINKTHTDGYAECIFCDSFIVALTYLYGLLFVFIVKRWNE